MAILIIAREFAVSGLRAIAAAEGYTIRASELGKTKMVSQVVAVSLVMLSIRWSVLRTAATICLWVVVFFSLASAIGYARKFWRGIDEKVKMRRRRELLMLARRQKREARILGRSRKATAE